jgi:hypothetical protein
LPVSQQTKVGFHGCYEQHQHHIADRIVLELQRGAKLEAKHKIIRVKISHFQDDY